MSDLKMWAAVKNGCVVHGFDATQDYIDNYRERVVEPKDVTTPPWYDDTVEFLDVTGIEPRPWGGFYRTSDGNWVNGNPKLTVSRGSIPSDGNTAAVVTFTQKGPSAPASIVFVVNGTQTNPEPVVNGEASIEVVSTTPGDEIVIRTKDQVTKISVEG